jgi:hypothetical protein
MAGGPLENLLRNDPLADLTGKRGGSAGAAHLLMGAGSTGAPEVGSALARSRTGYTTTQAQAAALGVDADVAGPNRLQRYLLEPMDRVARVGSGLATGLLGMDLADEVTNTALGGDNAHFLDLAAAARRAAAAARGEGIGFGDTEILQMDEDDSTATRIFKGGAAFLADTAVDPLNLVGFGAQAGRKAGAHIAEQAATRLITKNLDDLAGARLQRLADNAPSVLNRGEVEGAVIEEALGRGKQLSEVQIRDEVAKRMGNDFGDTGVGAGTYRKVEKITSESAKDLQGKWVFASDRGNYGLVLRTDGETATVHFVGETGEATIELPVSSLSPTDYELSLLPDGGVKLVTTVDDDAVRALATETLSRELAARMATGGPVGVRSWLLEEFGDELGEKMFAQLPQEVRGGLQVRVPFLRETYDEAGNRTLGVGRGGHRGAMSVGGGGRILDSIGMAGLSSGASNLRQAARLSKAGDAVTGSVTKFGEQYNASLRAIREQQGDFIGAGWTEYKLARDLDRVIGSTISQLDGGIAETFAMSRRAWDVMDNDVRGEFDRLFHGNVDLDELSQLAEQGDEAARAVLKMKASMNDLADRYSTLNDDFEKVSIYTPRILTDEASEALQALRPARASAVSSEGSATKSRSLVFDEFEVLDDGSIRIESWTSVTKINQMSMEKYGYKMFKDDPFEVYASYAKGMSQTIARAETAAYLFDTGLVTKAMTELGITDPTAAAKMRKLAEQTGDLNLVEATGPDADLAGRFAGGLERLLDGVNKVRSVTPETAAHAERKAAATKIMTDRLAKAVELTSSRFGLTGDVAAVLRDLPRALQDEAQGLFSADPEVVAQASARIAAGLQMLEELPNRAGAATFARAQLDKLREQAVAVQDQLTQQAGQLSKSSTHADVVKLRATEASYEALKNEMLAYDRVLVHAMSADQLPTDPVEFNRVMSSLVETAGELTSKAAPRVTSSIDKLLQDNTDLRRFATANNLTPLVLEDVFMGEALRNALKKRFEVVAERDGQFEKFVDKVYKPYMTLFRVTATVGRGPGFVARNVTGGLWNNYLFNVSASDHLMSTRTIGHQAQAGASVRAAMKAEGLDVGQNLNIYRVRVQAELDQRLASTKITTPDGTMRGDQAWALYKSHETNSYTADMLSSTGIQEALSVDDLLSTSASKRDLNLIDRLAQGKRTARVYSAEDIAAATGATKKAMLAANATANNAWINTMSDASATSEDFLRFAAFLAGVQRYGFRDEGLAAMQLVKAAHFDYGDLSDLERRVYRQVFPFWTWSKNNIPLQARAVMTNPGKINQLLRANETAKDIFGIDDDGEADGELPVWLREKFSWTTRFTTNNGDPIVFGVESPMTDLMRLNRREAMNSLNPLMGAAMQTMTGRDLATGAEFDPNGVELPGQWKLASPAFRALGLDRDGDYDGKRYISEAAYNNVKDLLPPVGMAERLLPLGQSEHMSQRRTTSLLSGLAGLPTATLTERQRSGELRARTADLRKVTDKRARELGVSRDAVQGALQAGMSLEQIAELLDSGQLREMTLNLEALRAD